MLVKYRKETTKEDEYDLMVKNRIYVVYGYVMGKDNLLSYLIIDGDEHFLKYPADDFDVIINNNSMYFKFKTNDSYAVLSHLNWINNVENDDFLFDYLALIMYYDIAEVKQITDEAFETTNESEKVKMKIWHFLYLKERDWIYTTQEYIDFAIFLIQNKVYEDDEILWEISGMNKDNRMSEAKEKIEKFLEEKDIENEWEWNG